MTKATEKYRTNYLITFFVSWALTIVPLVVFAILGLCNGEVSVTNKVSLGLTLTLVLFMSALNLFSKLNIKMTLIWGMLFAIYCTVDHFFSAILVMFLCTAVDEIIVTPLNKYYKRKYLHNKDADEREALNEKQTV